MHTRIETMILIGMIVTIIHVALWRYGVDFNIPLIVPGIMAFSLGTFLCLSSHGSYNSTLINKLCNRFACIDKYIEICRDVFIAVSLFIFIVSFIVYFVYLIFYILKMIISFFVLFFKS